jgi:hypothetical protein
MEISRPSRVFALGPIYLLALVTVLVQAAHIGVPVAAGGLAALGVAPVLWTSAALLVTSSYLTRSKR